MVVENQSICDPHLDGESIIVPLWELFSNVLPTCHFRGNNGDTNFTSTETGTETNK